MRRLPIALVLLLLAPVVCAQVYKWTDAHGTVHYSETPPPQGTPFKRITTSGAVQSATPASATTGSSTGEAAASQPASSSSMPNTPENLAKFCSAEKANLDLLKGKEGVVLQQGDKSVPLDETQRNQQIALAENHYRQFCSH
jgi:hypothetical protein